MMPSLFIAHGAPTIVMEEGPYPRMLESLAARYPKPSAIVLFSAHWESDVQQISAGEQYEMIYDFYGFPEQMYRMVYPAKGNPELASEIQQLLQRQGVESKLNTGRGMDHGAWTILKLIYPQADIPLIVLSVAPNLSPGDQYKIGQALAPLRKKGVLIIGSGGTVHNLRRINWQATAPDTWAVEFDHWVERTLMTWDLKALFAYEAEAPYAKEAVPANEHFIPLIYAMGAADGTRQASLIHRSYEYGSLSYTIWQFT